MYAVYGAVRPVRVLQRDVDVRAVEAQQMLSAALGYHSQIATQAQRGDEDSSFVKVFLAERAPGPPRPA